MIGKKTSRVNSEKAARVKPSRGIELNEKCELRDFIRQEGEGKTEPA